MNNRVLSLVLAGLVTGAAVAVMALQPRSAVEMQPAGEATISGKAQVGGPFTLTDQNGKRVTEKDFLGRYMLVFFGFTNCPDICPSGLQVMTAALEKLGPKAASITPVLITFDAKRDTPEKLAAYVKSFHPSLVALTGSEEEIAAAIKSYRVYVEKVVDDKNPDSYSFDHAALLYLMGKDGAFVAPIPLSANVDDLVTALDRDVK